MKPNPFVGASAQASGVVGAVSSATQDAAGDRVSPMACSSRSIGALLTAPTTPVWRARTWLLGQGWRKHGLIGIADVPSKRVLRPVE